MNQPRIIDLIYKQVAESVRNVKEMKRLIKSYVRNELFKDCQAPGIENKRFYPNNLSVRNHIYLATVRLRFSKINQINLEKKIEELKRLNPTDFFIFLKYSNVKSFNKLEREFQTTDEEIVLTDVNIRTLTTSKRLLLIHQTAWQRRLLSRYGNEMSMLDATYKTTRYSLPLFFLVVKTNVDYQVVASFVMQDEITASIAEPLHIIRGWCPEWNAKYFMVDNCDEEVNAIESVFPGKAVSFKFSNHPRCL